jgi:type II secretory pathway pseudopilin PulG
MNRSSGRGVSLIEATIVLSVVAILAGITAPAVGSYVDSARLARAREDARVIGGAIHDFIADNAENQFLIDGSNGTASEPSTRGDANRVNLLVSDAATLPCCRQRWPQRRSGPAPSTAPRSTRWSII